jgi:hypothetical protein
MEHKPRLRASEPTPRSKAAIPANNTCTDRLIFDLTPSHSLQGSFYWLALRSIPGPLCLKYFRNISINESIFGDWFPRRIFQNNSSRLSSHVLSLLFHSIGIAFEVFKPTHVALRNLRNLSTNKLNLIDFIPNFHSSQHLRAPSHTSVNLHAYFTH